MIHIPDTIQMWDDLQLIRFHNDRQTFLDRYSRVDWSVADQTVFVNLHSQKADGQFQWWYADPMNHIQTGISLWPLYYGYSLGEKMHTFVKLIPRDELDEELEKLKLKPEWI